MANAQAPLAFAIQYVLGAGGPAPGAAGSKLGIAVFVGGRIFVSAYGCLKATHTGQITYWAASPAVVGVTKTAFGTGLGASNLVPSNADLTTIGNLALATPVINALLAADPTWTPGYAA